MAAKNSPGSGGPSPRVSADVSRTSTDKPPSERAAEEPQDSAVETTEPASSTMAMLTVAAEKNIETTDTEEKIEEKEEEPDNDISQNDEPPKPQVADSVNSANVPVQKIELPLADVAQLTQDIDEIKKRQEEEIMEYIEKIDSLEAKVKYLSNNAAEAAKSSATEAPAGSAERKLAEKDEKIALLMQEGQKLSTTEQKLRLTLKKLRSQVADSEKQAEELKKGKEKAEADTVALRNKMESEDTNKIKEEAKKATAALQKEIDGLKTEKAAKEEAMKKQDQDAKAAAERTATTHSQALIKAVTAEREKHKALEDTISTLRSEKDSIAEKARQETVESREKLERVTERGRATEEELKHELASLEGKLEAMRTTAEEAFSGSGEDGQLKLLRQIETLQSQYASASDNWQGIEASLLTKVSTLEKERDEAQRRESEMRKKAREAVSLGNVLYQQKRKY